jgi:uncharacterized protein YndB with AHSA1/START domain
MPTITKTAELAAAPDQVWAKLTDLSAYGDWNVVHVGFPDGAPADLTPAATFKEKVKIMGMPGEVTWTVEAVEEAAKLELAGAGPMGTKMRTCYALEPNGGGTKLVYESEFGGAALAAMEGPLTKESDKAATESIEKLVGLFA